MSSFVDVNFFNPHLSATHWHWTISAPSYWPRISRGIAATSTRSAMWLSWSKRVRQCRTFLITLFHRNLQTKFLSSPKIPQIVPYIWRD